MVPRVNARLIFYSDTGNIVRLNVPRADSTLDEARVRTAMEDMISGGIVLTLSGTPTGIRSAELVTSSRAPLVNP